MFVTERNYDHNYEKKVIKKTVKLVYVASYSSLFTNNYNYFLCGCHCNE